MTHVFLIQQKKAIPFHCDRFLALSQIIIDTAKKESLTALFFYNNISPFE
jgi:hypothetical protein